MRPYHMQIKSKPASIYGEARINHIIESFKQSNSKYVEKPAKTLNRSSEISVPARTCHDYAVSSDLLKFLEMNAIDTSGTANIPRGQDEVLTALSKLSWGRYTEKSIECMIKNQSIQLDTTESKQKTMATIAAFADVVGSPIAIFARTNGSKIETTLVCPLKAHLESSLSMKILGGIIIEDDHVTPIFMDQLTLSPSLRTRLRSAHSLYTKLTPPDLKDWVLV